MAILLDGTVNDQNEVPVSGAQVYVQDLTGALADLEDELGQGIPNPLTTGEDGYYSAYVEAESYYTLKFYWGGRLRYIEADRPIGERALAGQVAVDAKNTAVAAAASADADATQTAADALATAADALATGTDRTAVAADRVLSETARAGAEDAAAGAQAFKGIYATTAAGIAATTSGQAFAIPSASVDGFSDLYTNVSGTATATGKTLPNASYIATAVGKYGPYRTAPAASSALSRLIDVRLFPETPEGEQITWPADIQVREIALTATQFRFRLGGTGALDGDNAYPEIARESAAAVGFKSPTGLTTEQEQPIYASSTALGVAAGRQIGVIRVPFGVTYGQYFPFVVFPFSQGALQQSRILPGVGQAAQTSAIARKIVRAEPDDTPFLPTVADTYLRSIVEDAYVERGVPGRDYVLQYRTRAVGGIWYLGFRLYDTVRQTIVAQYVEQRNTDWKAQITESVSLSNATIGSPIGGADYVGVEATLFLNRDKIVWTTTDWTTTTDPALAGIKTNRVLSKERVKQMIMTGQGIRNKLRTFGPGGDFPTLKAAVDSLFAARNLASVSGGDPNNIQRGFWPFSDICTPSHQWTLRAMPGHVETYGPISPAGVGYNRGILCWMGLTVELIADTDIKANYAGSATYLFDYNFGGRIIAPTDALLRTDDPISGVVHQDAGNILSKPSAANVNDKTAGQQFFEIYGLIQGGTYRAAGFPWSGGTSDGQDIVFDGTVFQTTGAGSNWNSHGSFNNVRAGYYRFRSVTLKGGTKSIAFPNTNTVVARHGVEIVGSDVTAVSNSGGGFVRIGKNAGTTYDAALEP